MTILRRRPKPKLGIRMTPDDGWRWPRHLAHVRRHCCVVPGCNGEPIEAAHIRKGLPAGEQGGTSLKPPDWWTFPACRDHHHEQHTIGELTFARKYGVDLYEAARLLVKSTTDAGMKEHLRNLKQSKKLDGTWERRT